MRNVSRTRGYTMLEIIIAAGILAIAIIPIYEALSGQSAREHETSKIALAKSIVSSLKEEIMSRPFDDVDAMVADGKLAGQPYPFTLSLLIEAQKKFKDFDLEVLAERKLNNSAIELRGIVTFSGLNQDQKKEEIIFLHVKQEY